MENELFGEAHEQEENGLFGKQHQAERRSTQSLRMAERSSQQLHPPHQGMDSPIEVQLRPLSRCPVRWSQQFR